MRDLQNSCRVQMQNPERCCWQRQVKPELVHVAAAPPSESYARLEYHEECEVSVNEQINIELNIRCRAH